MTNKSDSSQLVTSPAHSVQLTNHRRQLSADSASSLPHLTNHRRQLSADSASSLLLLNLDDVELNRFTRHVTTSPPVCLHDAETTADVNILDPLIEHPEHSGSTVPSSSAGTHSSVLEDEGGASAADEPLLNNAFSSTLCEYSCYIAQHKLYQQFLAELKFKLYQTLFEFCYNCCYLCEYDIIFVTVGLIYA